MNPFISRHARPVGLVALGALLASCQSILGIEDLSTDPREPGKAGMGQGGDMTGGGKGGSTGTGGTAGGTAARGGTGGSTGGAAGAAARGGSSTGGGAGAATGGSGGMGATGGAGGNGGGSGVGGTSSGNGGEGGMTEPPGETVTGKLIDFWHHPIPNTAVYIGGATATTDSSGTFVIPDVPATYDAATVIVTDNPMRVYEWAYLGLTRRDPTLQVNDAFADYSAHFYVTQVNGGTFDDYQWLLGIGSDSGADSAHAGPAGFDRSPSWWGPASTDWTLHSLFLERTSDLPSKYLAYETKTATTDENTGQLDFEMDLTEQTAPAIDAGNVSGAIVEDTGEGRTNLLFVRFTTGAPIALLDRLDVSGSAYQYLVPSLPNGSITVAAAETHSDGSYSIGHRDNLTAGDTSVSVVIPHPVGGLLPADEATNVGLDTTLSFNQGDPDNSGYLIHIENEQYQQGLYIVTANRQVKLSDVQILHDVIQPGAWHNWWVETHGQFGSTDEMTGPSGFYDEFGKVEYRPWGPVRADGAFTYSNTSDFQTASEL